MVMTQRTPVKVSVFKKIPQGWIQQNKLTRSKLTGKNRDSKRRGRGKRNVNSLRKASRRKLEEEEKSDIVCIFEIP